jgi:hypothetical protein
MIQIDGPNRKVYIKFINEQHVHRIITSTNGTQEFHHENGEESQVQIDIAGMGKKKIRVANLPPKVPDHTLRSILEKFGTIYGITADQWAKMYRYRVSNGVRLVNMSLKQHIPSHLQIVGIQVLITYDGQPQTCYGCNSADHQYQLCPNRRREVRSMIPHPRTTWVHVVTNPPPSTMIATDPVTEVIPQEAEANMEVTMDNPDLNTDEGPEPPRNAEPENPMTDILTSAKMITEQPVQETGQVQDTLLNYDVKEPCSTRRTNPSRNEQLQASEMEGISTKGEKEGTGVESQTATRNRLTRKEITRPPSDDDFPSLASSETHKKTKKLKMERTSTPQRERTRSKTRQATP